MFVKMWLKSQGMVSIKSLRNGSGNIFIKSKLLLLMNEKRPQGKLQFTSKNFQTILQNYVDMILYVERRF